MGAFLTEKRDLGNTFYVIWFTRPKRLNVTARIFVLNIDGVCTLIRPGCSKD